MAPFIDAVVIKGQTRQFTSTIQIRDENNLNFIPFDLSKYTIKLKVLGSSTADADVIVEHLITQVSDIETDGQITNAEAGEFTFTITSEDTNIIGLGKKPIEIDIMALDGQTLIYTLTEGGARGEYNKLYVVQV